MEQLRPQVNSGSILGGGVVVADPRDDEEVTQPDALAALSMRALVFGEFDAEVRS